MRYLIAGLGNPGEEYADTRHNVGQMVIDRLAGNLKIDFTEKAGVATASILLGNKEVILVKPNTFVNTTGPVIKALIDKFKVPSANLIIIHDDIDIGFAVLRIKNGGGTGGHRGLNSIVKSLGTDCFLRVRVGMGRPPGRMDPADFVLSSFSSKERPEIETAIHQAAKVVVATVREGKSAAMNRYNKTGK